MRFRSSFLLAFILVLSASTAAQQPRDPQAMTVLQQAVVSMGRSELVATGRIEVIAGSKTEAGTIQIVVRGPAQTTEHVQTPGDTRSVTFSQGRVRKTSAFGTEETFPDLSLSCESPSFALSLVVGALNNPDSAFQYVGIEIVGTLPAHHVRFWNSFLSLQRLQRLAGSTMKDLWIDTVTGLPLKLSLNQLYCSDAAGPAPVVIQYSDYRNLSGVAFPFRIEISRNGTPWANITVTKVTLKTGP